MNKTRQIVDVFADPCCRVCDDALRAPLSGDWWLVGRTMIVCSICGNKRCPKANNHDFACTGSNEPGQPGSAY